MNYLIDELTADELFIQSDQYENQCEVLQNLHEE